MNKHFMEVRHLGKPVVSRYNDKRGFSILIGVTIIGAVGLTLALAVSGFSQSTQNTSVARIASQQAQGYADACVETALQQVRDNILYTGSESIAFSVGTCTYVVSDSGLVAKSIESTGYSTDSARKVYVEVSALSPQIIISSWQEVAQF